MASLSLCLVTVSSLLFGSLLGDDCRNLLNTNDDLIRRIETLENKGIEQDTLLRQLVGELERQTKVNKEQQIEIERQRTEIENLKVDLAYNTDAHEGQSARRRLLLTQPMKPIAFYARIDQASIEHLALHDHPVFDVTVLDLGGDYNNETGVFMTPIDGIYFLSLSVAVDHDGKSIQAEIMKNGNNVAGSYAYGHGQGSISVVLQLNYGDVIYARTMRYDDAYLRGDTLTSFTGFLIAPVYK